MSALLLITDIFDLITLKCPIRNRLVIAANSLFQSLDQGVQEKPSADRSVQSFRPRLSLLQTK